MKRFIYTLPVFALLLPWTFISFVIFAVGFFVTPWSLLLLLPVCSVLASAFYIHQQRARHEQHFAAAVGASLVLVAPLVMIVVSAFTWGQDLALMEYHSMQDNGFISGPYDNPADPCNTAISGYGCDVTF